MNGPASILKQARTQGGSTTPLAGFPGLPADLGIPAVFAELEATTEVIAPEVRELVSTQVPLADQPPGNVAFLLVRPHATEHDRWAFSLQGVNSIEAFPQTGPRAQPDVVLADLAQDVNPTGTAQPSEILGIMYGFSQENREVPWWVNNLRTATGDDLNLVIIDYTGFEIPWELLTLPATENGAETYLGAAVSTARWQYIRDAQTFNDRLLQWTHEELAGSIAAFVDVQELKGGGQEIEVLTQLHATIERDLKQLASRLMCSEAGFGLVYLACHGQSSLSPLDYALGSASETGNRLVLGPLQAIKLHLFERSRAIVFINACHSGRMLKDNKYLHTGYLRGFPELFLSKGAVGVIGTTGFVNDAFAAKMADWFLHTLRTAEVPVSKLLRQWRKAVLDALPAERSEQDNVVLLNACMYVYYGNPQSRLRLTDSPQ